MVEAFKKMDKKILIIVACIILLPILLIIFLAIIQACSNSKLTPEKYEEKMISAAQTYLEEKAKEPTVEGETVVVKLSKLVSGGYIKSSEKLLGDESCEGSVTARRNGSTIEKNDGGFVNYTVDLKCNDYKTTTLKEKIMEDLTTSGSGLYNQNNKYIFKGEEVNNYITFFDNQYRIVSMDSNGFIKLLKVEEESNSIYWDVKFNVEVNDSYGKNIYKDSFILKQLLDDYNNTKKISNKAKKHIVSHSICVDLRNFEDSSINYNNNCTNTLENQVISLLDVEDFAKASLDPECISIYSKSCRNYNYLKDLSLNAWTYVADSSNTYEVYYLSNGIIRSQEASRYNTYNIVIYIDGNEKIASGDGSEEEPYVIK